MTVYGVFYTNSGNLLRLFQKVEDASKFVNQQLDFHPNLTVTYFTITPVPVW